MLKGWRTVIFNVVTFVVTFGGILLQYVGALGLEPQTTTIALIAINAIVVGGNIYLRSITDSPMGKKF